MGGAGAGGGDFSSDYNDVRRRLMDEQRQEQLRRRRHRTPDGYNNGGGFGMGMGMPGGGMMPGSEGSYYVTGVGEDPAESGYADFKLLAAAFRVWVRHASALRALRGGGRTRSTQRPLNLLTRLVYHSLILVQRERRGCPVA